MIKCYRCKKEKPRSEFVKDVQRSTGLTSNCRKCLSKRRKELYNKDEQRKKHLKYTAAHPDRRNKARRIKSRDDIVRKFALGTRLSDTVLAAKQGRSKGLEIEAQKAADRKQHIVRLKTLKKLEKKKQLLKFQEKGILYTEEQKDLKNYLINKYGSHWGVRKFRIQNYIKECWPHNLEQLRRKKLLVLGKYTTATHYILSSLPITDNPINEMGVLSVCCTKCGKQFYPSAHQTHSRIRSLNVVGKDLKFYCSNTCKKACPLHPFSLVIQEFNFSVLRIWSKEVIKRDRNTCQLCGSEEKFQAHHILPKVTNPRLAYDIDNGLCVCKPCHGKLHTGECSAVKLGEYSCLRRQPTGKKVRRKYNYLSGPRIKRNVFNSAAKYLWIDSEKVRDLITAGQQVSSMLVAAYARKHPYLANGTKPKFIRTRRIKNSSKIIKTLFLNGNFKRQSTIGKPKLTRASFKIPADNNVFRG